VRLGGQGIRLSSEALWRRHDDGGDPAPDGLDSARWCLPGPAVVVIPLGLAILATEFSWARRILDRIRGAHERLRGRRAAG